MVIVQYTQIRDEVRRRSTDNNGMVRTVPITVRQLEALVRISESLAKMKLQPEVNRVTTTPHDTLSLAFIVGGLRINQNPAHPKSQVWCGCGGPCLTSGEPRGRTGSHPSVPGIDSGGSGGRY